MNGCSIINVFTQNGLTNSGGGGGVSDGKVKVDILATADFLGATGSTGALRVDSTFDYVDGGNFVTLGLADNSVTTAKLVDLNVTTGKLADNSVTTAKILNSNVTLGKIEDIATNHFLGRHAGGSGAVQQVSASQTRAILNVEDGADVTDNANVITALNNIAGVSEGDVLYFNGTDWVRLARGTDGQVLTATATTVNWENASSGFADPMTTEGDIIYRSAGGTTRLAVGTNGQVLKSNGTTISWQNESSGGATWTTATASTSLANSIDLSVNYYVEVDGDADFNLTAVDPTDLQTGIRHLLVFIPSGATRTLTNGLTSMDNFGGSIPVTTSERLVLEIFKDNTGNVNIAGSVLS